YPDRLLIGQRGGFEAGKADLVMRLTSVSSDLATVRLTDQWSGDPAPVLPLRIAQPPRVSRSILARASQTQRAGPPGPQAPLAVAPGPSASKRPTSDHR